MGGQKYRPKQHHTKTHSKMNFRQKGSPPHPDSTKNLHPSRNIPPHNTKVSRRVLKGSRPLLQPKHMELRKQVSRNREEFPSLRVTEHQASLTTTAESLFCRLCIRKLAGPWSSHPTSPKQTQHPAEFTYRRACSRHNQQHSVGGTTHLRSKTPQSCPRQNGRERRPAAPPRATTWRGGLAGGTCSHSPAGRPSAAPEAGGRSRNAAKARRAGPQGPVTGFKDLNQPI
ncbi:uncharacterized protein LOC130257161 [Oenanthe melanoleuca]|uniref:uncharacterized protein LOC130257161 n=1 Tax=Oenanthe melanoleuca TaxID=2939378 RepID=UPI0024C19DE6|nr:uncharacterized protein LOC130257161 [Oenanthe melanoleuca]